MLYDLTLGEERIESATTLPVNRVFAGRKG